MKESCEAGKSADEAGATGDEEARDSNAGINIFLRI